MKRRPDSALPLPHLSYQILLALADGARHGWAVIRRINELAPGRAPSSGSLYLAMLRLQKQGLIEEVAAPAESESDDERRRYYGLTLFGAEVLRAETVRLAQLVEIARSRHVIGGRGSLAAERGRG